MRYARSWVIIFKTGDTTVMQYSVGVMYTAWLWD